MSDILFFRRAVRRRRNFISQSDCTTIFQNGHNLPDPCHAVRTMHLQEMRIFYLNIISRKTAVLELCPQ